jgi:hypothetical protein
MLKKIIQNLRGIIGYKSLFFGEKITFSDCRNHSETMNGYRPSYYYEKETLPESEVTVQTAQVQ